MIADRTREIARGGLNLDLGHVATEMRVVLGATNLGALRAALDVVS